MLEVGVFGATGYAGHELLVWLNNHPGVRVAFAASNSHARTQLKDLYPAGPDVVLSDPAEVSMDGIQAVFLAVPHTTSAPLVHAALQAGARVIDLSADFRLHDAGSFSQWYGQPHGAPELLAEAVYGLTETCRPALPAARLVANPGCYPTGALLPLYPLVVQGALAAGPVVIDAKSGVSGAGRTPQPSTHYVEVADNLTPYMVGNRHRHLPEMVQALFEWQAPSSSVVFVPQIIPAPRGILSNIYVQVEPGWDETRLRAAMAQVYSSEPFIEILGAGHVPSLAHALHTNRCVIGINLVGETAILTSAIDNLVKGAAGQAIQNFNLMFGFEESLGLV